MKLSREAAADTVLMPSNIRIQLTALRAAADTERYTHKGGELNDGEVSG